MSVNSSSSSNDSLLHPTMSSIDPDFPIDVYCFKSRPSSFIITSYFIFSALIILPLCIFIIYHGLQQWRLNGSTSSAATMSHSDSFTYNMVTIEMIGHSGFVFMICGIYSDHWNLFFVGFMFGCFMWYGKTFFHVLTCVERYLAVVHPITYLSLRQERGIRIRNISITCVWLLCVVGSILESIDQILIVKFCLLLASLIIVSFCSVSVLCVLIGPGPGEQGGGRKKVDQSKLRAFYTIMIILGVLVFRFTGNVVWAVVTAWSDGGRCIVLTVALWLNLPSSLVLPLLFLHRAGKLVCCKKHI